MRKAVRAIIVKDDQLLVIKRNKFGSEYYTLPGGKIDMGETAEAAIAREVREECSVEISNLRLVIVEEAGDPYGTQYIYKGDYVGGEPKLDPASTEAAIHAMGQNLYIPMWLPLSDLPQTSLVSIELRQCMLEGLKNDFTGEVQTIHSNPKMSYNS